MGDLKCIWMRQPVCDWLTSWTTSMNADETASAGLDMNAFETVREWKTANG